MSAPRVRFVDVPATALFAFLEGKGFARVVKPGEVVYTRRHHNDTRFVVLVYTSVRPGAARARKCGADAVRVCAVFTPEDKLLPSRGVVKLPKVLRTAPANLPEAERLTHFLERVAERMREAYAKVNELVVEDRVRRGGPRVRPPGLTNPAPGTLPATGLPTAACGCNCLRCVGNVCERCETSCGTHAPLRAAR